MIGIDNQYNKRMFTFTTLVLAVGLGVTISVARLVYIFYIRAPLKLRKYGEWAVVTGATDGIGKAYANELAHRGLNIVLVSRTQSKLQDCAKEIETKYNVKTAIAVIDFSTSNRETVQANLGSVIENLDIGILINNVGMGYDHPEFYLDLPEGKVDTLIKLNICSLTDVTSVVLPGMVKRKRGAVVNLSSSSGFYPTGLLTVYSAGKAFVDFFSRGLNQEYAASGVHVQSLLPLFVTTKLSKRRRPSFFVPTPEAYCKQACNTIGIDDRTTGYFSHALQISVGNFLPAFIRDQYIYSMHAGIRKLAYKKKAQKKD